jgi:hypothetical protein
MKTLTLTNEEFDFLQSIFETAYTQREQIKEQMKHSPASKLLELLEEMAPMVTDRDAAADVARLKADRERSNANMFAHLDSLHVKFTYLASNDQ